MRTLGLSQLFSLRLFGLVLALSSFAPGAQAADKVLDVLAARIYQ